jgi:hypothetical protein
MPHGLIVMGLFYVLYCQSVQLLLDIEFIAGIDAQNCHKIRMT